MENELAPAAHTPSRLRPPKPRKEFQAVFTETTNDLSNEPCDTLVDIGLERRSSNQKRRIESPKSNRPTSVVLPQALPAAKSYKSAASATGKPVPVTKPVHRQVPKTAAVGKPKLHHLGYNPLQSIACATGQRPSWDRKVLCSRCLVVDFRVGLKKWKR